MPFDFTTAMQQATVQVEQVPVPGTPTVLGTGLLVSDPAPDGTPRVVLVTARHVIERIGGTQLQIGLHLQGPDGGWRREWRVEPTVDGEGPLWVRHGVYDVAALPVQVPPEAAAQAIPVSWWAQADTFDRIPVQSGDAMQSLGYPEGLASDPRGFAILRVGHVASYPLTPATEGTFLLDSPIVSGNSGGPVFVSRRVGRRAPAEGSLGPQPDEFIAGIVAQQIEPGGQSIALGLVVHAMYVRQTLQLLDARPAPAPVVAPPPAAPSTPEG